MKTLISNMRIPRPAQPGWQKGILTGKEIISSETSYNPLNPLPTREQLHLAPKLLSLLERIVPKNLADEISHSVFRQYDQETHVHAMLEDRLQSSRALRAFIHTLYDEFLPRENSLLVETGCGPALALSELAPQRLQGNWHAFDCDLSFVAQARAKAQSFGLPVTVHHRTAYLASSLPCFKNGAKADYWVGLSSFDSIYDLLAAITAMRTVLKPGGRFIHIQDVGPVKAAAYYFGRQFPEQARTWLTKASLHGKGDEEIMQYLQSNEANESVYFEHQGIIMNAVDELHARLLFCLQKRGFRIVEEGIAASMFLGERLIEHDKWAAHPQFGKPNGFANHRGEMSPMLYPNISEFVQDSGLSLAEEDAFLETVVANYIVAENN